jgi:hypothetical protein
MPLFGAQGEVGKGMEEVGRQLRSAPDHETRDMYEPDLHIDNLKLKARNFR